MIVVNSASGRLRCRSRHRTALVLGAGGVLGAAWMTGALARLQDRLPNAVAGADVIIGTSAGSVLAAALRCGATPQEMAAWQCGGAASVLGAAAALAAQGKRVVILTPGTQDLAVMGANPMNHKRREAVLETSLRTSAAALASPESTFRAAA